MDIKPGALVSIEIVARPRAAAALKTLQRVCAKDPAVKKKHREMKRNRPSWQDWIRGGRFWHHQMKTKPAAAIEPGAVFNLRASLDVIRDLESAKHCIKITQK